MPTILNKVKVLVTVNLIINVFFKSLSKVIQITFGTEWK